MGRRKKRLTRKEVHESNVSIIMSGKGSIDYIREHGNKGVFYCPTYDDKILLVENLGNYKETFFDSMDDLKNYVEKVYG